MTVFNKKIEVKNPIQAIRAGISLIPENRNEEGIFLLLSVLQNIASSTIDSRQSWGLVKRKRERGVIENISSELSIKLISLDQTAQSLSGGNLQKLVLAKWLLVDPKVIVMLEPTKGVDVGTKQEIYRLIRRLAKKGVAIIVYTSEMLELVGLCDRVLIMNHGFFTASLERKKITEENIMKSSVSNINLLVGIK
jgi:ABC-type sugar transport system ATPase subunit